MTDTCTTLNKIRIRYIDADGKIHDLDAVEGDSLMTLATAHGVRGIDGDCGGNCACGTCLIRIDPAAGMHLPPPDDAERELLDFLSMSARENRLGCQIRINKKLEGMSFVVSASN